MLHRTPSGCCEKDIGSSKAHVPQVCAHGELLIYTKQLGRSAGTGKRPTLKRTQRRETAAEKKARLRFNKVVKGWPCWFGATRPCEECGGTGCWSDWNGEEGGGGTCGLCEGDGKHRCSGIKDAHHLIPKDFIRQRFRGLLPEDELLEILFNPLIGAPLCRKAHDAITSKSDRIYWQDLTDECLEYVGSLPDFMLLRLERECLKRPERSEVAV